MKKRTTKNQLLKEVSFDEAEDEVYRQVKSGTNFRDITKLGFLINGIVKHFNPSQISKIKTKFEPKIDTKNLDLDKAKVFKLFKKGMKPTNVLIKTGLGYDFVDKAHREFLEFENRVIVPQWFEEYMYNLAFKVGDVNNLPEVYRKLRAAVDSHLLIKKFPIICNDCKKPFYFDENAFREARLYLMREKWCGEDCRD